MSLNRLKSEYYNLLDKYDEVKATDFIDELTKLNNIEALEFHYEILKNKENEYLFNEIRGDFYKHGDKGKYFLIDKLRVEKDIELKSEALFILGTLDNLTIDGINEIKKMAKKFLTLNNYTCQYYGIIVLGWIGNKEDLAILFEELTKNKNKNLRGYAATALRQVWYNHTRLKKGILKCYYNALLQETDIHVIGNIIACVQDLVLKKFGIRENMRGEILGNINEAKPKAIKAIKKIIEK